MNAFRSWVIGTVVVLELTAPVMAVAAEGDSLGVGSRVRVSHLSVYRPRRFAGVVESLEPDSLRVRRSTEDLRSVAWHDLKSLEHSVGRRSRAGTGALIGCGIGLATGALIGASTSESYSYLDWGSGFSALVGGVIGLGVGALLGLGVGAAVRTDKWQPVDADSLRKAVRSTGEGR